MQEFRGITLGDPVDIANTELMLINQQPICRRIIFEKRNRAFDPPNPTNEGTGKQRNDTEVSDEKCDMMLFPRPARKCRDGKVRAEQNEPKVEPGRSIYISARYFGV